MHGNFGNMENYKNFKSLLRKDYIHFDFLIFLFELLS